MSFEKVLERVRKLRALAQSSNVNEAAAAAAEAQRLLTEHRISEAQLESAAPERDEPVTQFDVLRATKRRQVQSWELRLAAGVARANSCRVYKVGKNMNYGVPGQLNVVGRKADVEAVVYLYLMLRKEIERLCRAWADDLGGAVMNTERTSFKFGAAAEIARRMMEAKDTAMKAAQSTALIVINKADLAAQARVHAITGGSQHKDARLNSATALAAGRRAGAQVNIGGNAALGSAPQQLRGRS